MKIPILLTEKELLDPLVRTRKRIDDIKSRIERHEDNSLEVQGLFVMSVSQLEVMLNDMLKYFLSNFPGKFPNEDIKISKEEILEAVVPIDILKSNIDKQIYSEGYKKFEIMLKDFCRVLSVNYERINTEVVDHIIEIKESRNLLVHNNLVVNKLYLSRAGRFKRVERMDTILKITKQYLSDSCDFVTSLLDSIEKEIIEKYSSYTKIEAIKKLWSFMFTSEVMPFDDFWEINLEKDHVFAAKKGRYEGGLASSEYKLLGLWRAHFNGNTEYLKDFNMFSFDEGNKKKVLYFLSIVDDFRLE